MTKTGKPDSYWAGVMQLYAQGKFRFTTGKRPGARRWKSVIQRIDTCPLTPAFNQKVRTIDIFGKKIPCNCGYHTSNVVNIVGKRSWVQLVCFIILKKVMSHQAKHHHLCQTNIKYLNYMGYQQLHPINQQHLPRNQQYFPRNQQHLPRNQQHLPRNQQYFPRNQQHLPRNQQHLPRNQQYFPRNQQHLPRNQQHLPRNQHLSHNSALQQCNTPSQLLQLLHLFPTLGLRR
ncbi:uncharacterized protein LOC114146335 [Xiphophorus couchianus]|uniref:uncharacterized protein LOC114146335 n=1 Tax=Xiphophorus couchianus TaxID=32473 RepID=UPI0010166F96|nr:uncharacterized protein LOC114146335 [Xiphophorus couchianus]